MGAVRLRCGPFEIGLSQPVVMGVLNVTPDSFSDGGRFIDPGRAADAALAMVDEGASIIDIGGESTRPGAPDVPLEEERARVMPVLRRLMSELSVPLSVDTQKPAFMVEAIDAGASLINDVNALQSPGALDAVRDSEVAVCLMHMRGKPASMQEDPRYNDVVTEVIGFLRERVAECRAVGFNDDQLLLDPGFGFGKTVDHNLSLVNGLGEIGNIGPPLLAGLSRKSMIGVITGRDVEDRLAGSIALAVMAVERGAQVIRAHDVAATVDALKLVAALRREREQQ